jgi:hypothetical protein
LGLHAASVRRKSRRLLSAHSHPRKPGPKGPSEARIRAVVELKSGNPRFGCPRIARIIARTFGVDLFRYESLVLGPSGCSWSWIKCTRRLVGVGVHAGAVTGIDLCRLFNAAIHGQGVRGI